LRYLALAYPAVSLVVLALMLLISIWLLPKLWRFIHGIVERIGRWFAGGAQPPSSRIRNGSDV